MIGGLKQTYTSDVKIYFADGIPSGASSIFGANFTPTLISLSPNVGSAGGSTIEVTGSGFGLETPNLNLWHTPTNQLLCSEVTQLSYGKFLCKTLAIEISSADTINLYASFSQYPCGNTATPADCTL